MPAMNFGNDRYAALQATKHFTPGTIGYGVHQGISLLYNGVGGVGGYGNKYCAEIGKFFQQDDIQQLMAKPITDSEANLKVAQKEVDYWTSVLNNPYSSSDDKRGAEIALKFPAEVRAELQELFATGDTENAVLLVLQQYPGVLVDGVENIVRDLIHFGDFLLKSVIQDIQELISDLQTLLVLRELLCK